MEKFIEMNVKITAMLVTFALGFVTGGVMVILFMN